MDLGYFYKRARAIKHKAATPFYSRKPAQVAPPPPVEVAPATPAHHHHQAAGSVRAKPTTVVAPRSPMPAPPPAAGVVPVEAILGNGDAADVDRRAAMYISRVLERLRRERERVADDWRKHY